MERCAEPAGALSQPLFRISFFEQSPSNPVLEMFEHVVVEHPIGVQCVTGNITKKSDSSSAWSDG